MNETASLHRKAWDLIPWILNGSASAQDRLLVHEHLNQCEDCRAELDFQRSLQTALQQQAPVNELDLPSDFRAPQLGLGD